MIAHIRGDHNPDHTPLLISYDQLLPARASVLCCTVPRQLVALRFVVN